MKYITTTILKWNILPQQKDLPSIRCVEEKITEFKQSVNNIYKPKAEEKKT